MEPFQFVFDSQRSLRGAGNLYTSAAHPRLTIGQVFDRTGHVGTPRPGASKAVGLVEIVGKDLCFGPAYRHSTHAAMAVSITTPLSFYSFSFFSPLLGPNPTKNSKGYCNCLRIEASSVSLKYCDLTSTSSRPVCSLAYLSSESRYSNFSYLPEARRPGRQLAESHLERLPIDVDSSANRPSCSGYRCR